ncbi:chaperone NapD [Comamonas suwonensis]|uniref:chaperone NapD n=1 Tax=Comamonas suwonensis TaxID=2606214 RepID=UPI001F1D7C0D|nr:chaperone NapD [Comamonas suwonensis]
MHEESDPIDANTDLHITSLVVHVLPKALEQVVVGIIKIKGAQIHGSHPAGKLVITLEAHHARDILDCVSQIELLDGVINASLVYQHVENWQSLNQEVTHD